MTTRNHGAPDAGRLPRLDLFRLLLFVLIALYVAIFTSLAVAQHAGMRTHRSDLGQIDQAVWNSSRGRWLEMTDNGFVATRLTDHVEPILILISPVFWLWDDVRALLLLQALFVGVGAWPLYELARRQCEKLLRTNERARIWLAEPVQRLSRGIALALAGAYLLAPPLQSALLTEFHAAPLAVPLILWAFWAAASGRWRPFSVAVILVALVKEEMALMAAGLGVWALWRMLVVARFEYAAVDKGNPIVRAVPRVAVILVATVTLLSVAWFYVTTFVIVPAHAVTVYGVAESGYFQRYGALGDSPADIFRSFLTQPELVWQIAMEPARLDYWRRLMQPFGYLSLLAPEIILLSSPLLLANLLSAYPAQYYGEFHYSAPVAVYFAVSAAYGAARLWRWMGRRTIGMSGDFQHLPAASTLAMNLMAMLRNARAAVRPLLAASLVLWLLSWGVYAYAGEGRGPGGGRYDATPRTSHHLLLPRFVGQIPRDAALTATAAVHPHVSHRRYVYQFPLGLEGPVPADWALLDVTTATDMAPGDVRTLIEMMLADDWGIVDAADGFLLMHKGEGTTSIPDAFYSFARVDGGDTEVVSGAGDLTFVGIEALDWPRWRQTRLQTDWLVGDGFDPARMAPQITIRAANRDIIYRFVDAMPPALVWYPPQMWQPDERIRITTLPLYLPDLWGVIVDNVPGLTISTDVMATSADSDRLVGVFQRSGKGHLVRLPETVDRMASYARTRFAGAGEEHTFRTQSGEELRVEGWLDVTRAWTDGPLYVWLHWQGEEWPEEYVLFVHLRRQGELLDQVDGPLQYFVVYDKPDDDIASQHPFVAKIDLRQLQLNMPSPTEDAAWQVVVGLYEPQSGTRAEVFTPAGRSLGQEWVLGTLPARSRPAPDQACALIPATCISQPETP